jgi:GGDEF domain-containing protein
MAQQVIRRIEARLQSDAEEPKISVSIGIGLFPEDGHNAKELLSVADRQMYQKKREHKGIVRSDAVAVRTRQA